MTRVLLPANRCKLVRASILLIMPEVKEDTVRGYLCVFSFRPAAPGIFEVVGGIRHLPGVLARKIRVICRRTSISSLGPLCAVY